MVFSLLHQVAFIPTISILRHHFQSLPLFFLSSIFNYSVSFGTRVWRTKKSKTWCVPRVFSPVGVFVVGVDVVVCCCVLLLLVFLRVVACCRCWCFCMLLLVLLVFLMLVFIFLAVCCCSYHLAVSKISLCM